MLIHQVSKIPGGFLAGISEASKFHRDQFAFVGPKEGAENKTFFGDEVVVNHPLTRP